MLSSAVTPGVDGREVVTPLLEVDMVRNRNVMLRFDETELARIMAAWESSQKAKTHWERTPFAPWLRMVVLNLFPAPKVHDPNAVKRPAKTLKRPRLARVK